MASIFTPVPTFRWRPLIKKVATLRELPSWIYKGVSFSGATWLEGLVYQESSGNHLAIRYEPHQDRGDRPDRGSDQDTPGLDDVWFEDDKSYGLMQIMGYNIKRLTMADIKAPVKIDFRPFVDPELNLILGTRLMKMELDATAGDVTRALARYNGGPSGNVIPPFRNQGYVDLVFDKSRRIWSSISGGV